MPRELTAKQEKFCQCIVYDKMTYSDAYRNSYNAKNMKDSTINEKASIEVAKDKIKARIRSLKADIYDELNQEIVYSKKMSFDKLTEIQKLAKEKEQYNIATKNEELKGKMLGYYEDVHKHIGDKDNPIETNITVEFIGGKNE